MTYLCAEKIVASISNGFVEVSHNQRKVTLVGFDDDISNTYIPIGDDATDID